MSTSQKRGQITKLKPRPLGLKEGLTEMYQGELLCDVTLVADGQRFPCHRALLAAVSPYFRDVFVQGGKELEGSEVQLENVPPSLLQSILKYIYTEELALTADLAPSLFTGASQLQIIPLETVCCRFLVANLSVQNCFEMYSLAQVHHSKPLLHAVLQLLIRNFEQTFEGDNFLRLDPNDLTAIISDDGLEVASELKVYQAVRRWVQGEASQRRHFLGHLLQQVRFPLLGPEEQDILREDLLRWDDFGLERKVMDGPERLRESCGLRQGMYKPHILCIDTQMCEYQQLESEEAHVSCYEPQAEVWEKLPGVQSLTHACCTSNGDKIYLSGGVHKNAYSNAVYEFDAFTNQWQQLPAMAVPRAAHGFVFDRQKLYAMGGWRRFQSFLNLAETLDLDTGIWTPMAKLPFALSHPASSVLREKVYLLGGATGVSNHWLFHKGVLIYVTASNTWTQVPLATGFFAAGAVAAENGIYVIGGYTEKKNEDWQERALVPENRHSTRKCFFVNESGKVNPNVAIPKLRRGLANAAVVRCGKRIYVLGGEDLSQRYKVIYHWQPGESRWHRASAEIPVPREGISRFGCATLLRPKPHILQLFQVTSVVIVSAIAKS
ncbi:PREDICTED: kelch-like protein 3 [Thamnophis sirtalis]|uniref:Kelch-like protein 3 n=1 Tax=Thamnophis sirtalis TaxID=35019 RepID=A0A6I9Z0S0_9SAUR|nr:PREDICTED: kelch-like protein 3 [Thamnophis sirtalis]